MMPREINEKTDENGKSLTRNYQGQSLQQVIPPEIPYSDPDDPGFDERFAPMEVFMQSEPSKGVIHMEEAKEKIEGKRKSKVSGSAPKRLPMPDIERYVHSLINQRKLAKEFTVYIPDRGHPQVLEFVADQNIMRVVEPERMASVLVKNLSGEYALTFKEGVAIVKRWQWDCSHAIPKWPAPVAFKDDKAVCFSRLNFNPAEKYCPSDYPILSEALSRMSNAKSFCALIGAALTPDAPRKKALWLYGDSDSGKSFLLNYVLAKIAGGRDGTAIFSGDGFTKSSHWQEFVVGKSLLIINEADAFFLKQKLFLSLTGDDEIGVNPKGKAFFSAPLSCRLFLSSNESPEIPNKAEIKNRLVVCNMTAFKGQKLAPQILSREVEKELPFFVAMCLEEYRATGGEIIPDMEELENAIADHEEQIQVIFDNSLILDVSSHVTAQQLVNYLERPLAVAGISLHRFRRFIKERYGVVASQSRDFGGPGARGYRGIKLRLETMRV